MKYILFLVSSVMILMIACNTEEYEGGEVSSIVEGAPYYGSAFGDVDRGKILFNDTNFGQGTSGGSCNTCHPGGRGLESAGEKEVFHIMGQTQHSLEEAVNACIVAALKGTSIPVDSSQMQDIVAYIRSIGEESSAE